MAFLLTCGWKFQCAPACAGLTRTASAINSSVNVPLQPSELIFLNCYTFLFSPSRWYHWTSKSGKTAGLASNRERPSQRQPFLTACRGVQCDVGVKLSPSQSLTRVLRLQSTVRPVCVHEVTDWRENVCFLCFFPSA